MKRKKISSMKFPCVIVLVTLLTFVKPDLGTAAEQAATVLMVSPCVASHQGGKATTLEVKMKVPVTATVISDAAGRAQLMFPDTTTVSIAPGTEIALAEFVDDPKEENIVLNMAKGTARFITGEVSRRNPSAMTVNTPQAVVGIRGTMVTVAVSGDTTKVYLTETSGLGVTVTDRNSGEQRKIVKPGNIITVTPRGMEERAGRLDEVRKMTVDLHSAPRITDNERRLPVGMANITPAGDLGASGGFDTALNVLEPNMMQTAANTGMDLSLIKGDYRGSGSTPDSAIEFTVDGNANISNANFWGIPATTAGTANVYFDGSGGHGTINSNGSFNNVGGFTVSGGGSATMTGSFNSLTSGSWTVSGNSAQGTSFGDSGSFTKDNP